MRLPCKQFFWDLLKVEIIVRLCPLMSPKNYFTSPHSVYVNQVASSIGINIKHNRSFVKKHHGCLPILNWDEVLQCVPTLPDWQFPAHVFEGHQ